MANLKIGRITMGSCATNCYFVYPEGEKKVLFFDPADQGEYLYRALKQKGFEIAAILLTHGHFDHIWGAQKLRELSGAKIYACREEEALLLSADMNVSEMAGRACTVKANALLEDGQEMTIEGMTFRVILTPGHTAGSCCYYFEEDGILVSGDTLFQESVGRTDFPTGSYSEIIRSIREKLFVLPDEVRVYPGHGDATSIGYEKIHNPFCV